MKGKQYLLLLSLLLLIVSFFLPAMLRGRLPIPADTIVGLYHPYRDLFAADYPNGIPFKNFLITDPVRQQYPWKYLSMHSGFSLPTWNPYTFAGAPLLANFQSGVFYPFNLFLLVLPFMHGWGIYIMMQPLLAGAFLYFYLRNLKCSPLAAILGGFTFAFCGFSVAWLEWGNIIHTALWLPLVLLSIDKVFTTDGGGNSKVKSQKSKTQSKNKELFFWSLTFLLSLTFSFFAGHLQTFFYLSLITASYVLLRWFESGRPTKQLFFFALYALLFAILTFPQWYPTLLFINESARSVDQADWRQPGWFLPWQHLVQFLAPDFFGNPTTLNYFGVWNYGEFIGYVGIFPLLLSLYALGWKRDRLTWFYGSVILLSLLFALPTVLSKLPYQWGVPFLSTAQPTRLLFLIDFSLAVLAALGFDYLVKTKQKIAYPLVGLSTIFAVLWGIMLFAPSTFAAPENLPVIKRNLQLPTLLLFGTSFILFFFSRLKNKRITLILLIALVMLTVADMSRFAAKFTPFTTPSYLYPSTQLLSFLQTRPGYYRYMTTDSRILPPNFSLMYRLQTVDGYDPLYLRRYGELIAASERNAPDISPPLGFNRIITPHRYASRIIDLLGVKYVLSLSDLDSPTLRKVFQEGETRVYENTQVLPRAFFVQHVTAIHEGEKQSAIDFLFDQRHDLTTSAVVEVPGSMILGNTEYATGSARIEAYWPGMISIRTKSSGEGFLILTDSFYPTWKAVLITNARSLKRVPMYRTDYNFRGIVVPAGEHIVELSNSLF